MLHLGFEKPTGARGRRRRHPALEAIGRDIAQCTPRPGSPAQVSLMNEGSKRGDSARKTKLIAK